jgi:ribonuclease P protein component
VSTARATLPRTVKLRGAAQFTGRFQNRYSSRHLLLLTRPGGCREGSARLGIIIGRRQISRAVDRSQLRRVIREAFRRRRHDLGATDVVLKYQAGGEKYDELVIRSELKDLFARAAS